MPGRDAYLDGLLEHIKRMGRRPIMRMLLIPALAVIWNMLDDRFRESCVVELVVWWRIPCLRLAIRGVGSWQDGGEQSNWR
jgi:hypothetical protein